MGERIRIARCPVCGDWHPLLNAFAEGDLLPCPAVTGEPVAFGRPMGLETAWFVDPTAEEPEQ